eukprot:3618418-Pyramimonas_sp.AAC.1
MHRGTSRRPSTCRAYGPPSDMAEPQGSRRAPPVEHELLGTNAPEMLLPRRLPWPTAAKPSPSLFAPCSGDNLSLIHI